MKNITLAMVAILAAVTMLSAVLAVPMQEANAEKRGDGDSKDGDKKDGKDGGNNLKIKQVNECEKAFCSNYLGLYNDQRIEED